MYIHYGHPNFNINKFSPIKNDINFTKPHGGFWASRVDAKFGWKDWCQEEDFRLCSNENSFVFKCNDNAHVKHLRSLKDLYVLPKIDPVHKRCGAFDWYLIDFEQCLKNGIDAIELYFSDNPAFYYLLYGWDCDSILILNPNIVEVVKR